MSALVEEQATQSPWEQDSSSFTHIVNCPDDKESSEAWVTEACVFGLTLTALCGHQWVPTKDVLKHPICPACVDEANRIIAEVNS